MVSFIKWRIHGKDSNRLVWLNKILENIWFDGKKSELADEYESICINKCPKQIHQRYEQLRYEKVSISILLLFLIELNFI